MSNYDRLVSHIIRGRNVSAKSLLLKWKYLYKFVDNSGRTLLHLSAKHGNVEMSRFLIQCGCQVNAQDTSGITPLMLAVIYAKDDATVNVLLNANADIYLADFRKSSSLRKVIKISQSWLETLTAGLFKQTKYYQILKMFFLKVEEQFACNRELMAKNLREAHCPLALIIFMGNVTVTKYLLNSGYPLNEQLRNWSTLHIAVLLMDLSNVTFLIEFGADVNDRDNLHQTPLFLYDRHVDDSFEQLEILKVLLNNGASLLIPRSDGVTLMEYFFTSGKKNTLMALVQSNTDELTKCTIDGKTPLHFWVQNQNPDVDKAIKILSRKNIDVNAADNEGVTALIKAVSCGALNKIIVLIEIGARINFIDIFNKTNLFNVLIDPVAFDAKHAKIANILLHRGSLTPANKVPILHLAFQLYRNNTFNLAKMLLKHLVLDEASGEENVSVDALAKIESNIELKEYYESCKLQLQATKRTTVYETVTLYKLLTESEEKITLYARNNEFIERFEKFMENKSHNNFFDFDYLRKRADRAIELAALRREVSRFICQITRLYPDPNDNIFYKIVKHMSKNDLYNLIEV